jgi:hypothetical protein
MSPVPIDRVQALPQRRRGGIIGIDSCSNEHSGGIDTWPWKGDVYARLQNT